MKRAPILLYGWMCVNVRPHALRASLPLFSAVLLPARLSIRHSRVKWPSKWTVSCRSHRSAPSVSLCLSNAYLGFDKIDGSFRYFITAVCVTCKNLEKIYYTSAKSLNCHVVETEASSYLVNENFDSARKNMTRTYESNLWWPYFRYPSYCHLLSN